MGLKFLEKQEEGGYICVLDLIFLRALLYVCDGLVPVIP